MAHWRAPGGALVLAALASAGAVGALAGDAAPDRWVADPDSQYLLDVHVRQLRLGEGVRAYETPGGACLVVGDAIRSLDLPLEVDLVRGTMRGWALAESRKIALDRGAATVSYGDQAEKLAAATLRDTPEGWCVDAAAFGRWIGLELKPRLNGSALIVESQAKLPVELAAERQRRAAQLKRNASIALSSLPQVKLPYRMWRRPALDFVVSGGVTYRASSGTRIDRRAAVYAAGEIATLSYNAQIATDDKGVPQHLRLRAFRSDPEGGLLGPLGATHFEMGDVSGYHSRLLGSAAAGRGVAITNRPLANPTAFDRTRFEGDLPAGWEAELYRNDQLLAFARGDSGQRYVFDDVQLLYGENRIAIVLYGPQGQVRTRHEMINVGQDNVPPGKTWYWAGVSQPGRDLLALRAAEPLPDVPRTQATASLAHGIDQKTSLALTLQAVELEDERLTYVEGTVRRSIGPALAEIGVARDNRGGLAGRAQLLARVGSVNVSAEALAARDFRLNGVREPVYREARVTLDAPLTLGRTLVPVHGDLRYKDRGPGGRQLEAAMRLSTHVQRFNLGSELRYRKNLGGGGGPAPPDELEASLIASGRVGDVRLRGVSTFDLAPERRLRSAELSAYWSASERADFEAAVAYDATSRITRGRLTHVRRLDAFALALTAEAASDGSIAAGFNLNFSLDPSSRAIRLSRQPLASAGAVRATVYRDLNDNGRRDSGEPAEKGALITTGSRLSERTTDASGKVMIAGLAAYAPVTVGVDTSSLADPTLAPKKALQVVTPRAGIAAEVEIGLVGAGDIEGVVARDGGDGFEGLELELVDASGTVIAATRSDFDGFFLFERVAYGRYTVRISADSARIAGVARELGFAAEVNGDKPLARMGAARVTRLVPVAALETPEKSSGTTLR